MSSGTNGTFIPRRITIDQIINSNQDAEPDSGLQRQQKAVSGVGLLSKTLFKSSMTKWIISARIRGPDLHELLFIGENEVRVKEILQDGVLRRLTTISNFSSQIRAAAVIGEELELTARTPIKTETSPVERNSKFAQSAKLPPQILVLALESAELRFVVLDTRNPSGVISFRQTSFPLPIYRSLSTTPGRSIAVDPQSRALAVAANKHTILLFSLKGRATLEAEFAVNPNDWNPIFQERQLRVDGSILAIDFLHPGPGNGSHIVLVIVAVVGGLSRLSCYEWEQTRGLEGIRPVVESLRLPKSEADFSSSFELHSPVDTANEHCNLMIPMAGSPSFLLVHGSEVRICRNILSGTPQVTSVPARAWEQDPRHWGSSTRRPAYTAWTRCGRIASWKNKGNESLYLIREDGVIRNYTRGNDLGTGSLGNAGQFDCTVSTAVSSFLLHLTHPDCLVAAGHMCNGQVVSFGDQGSSSSREEAMALKVRRTFSDWAPIMDLQIALPLGHIGGESSRRPYVFTTSGRQPYGAITELRKGLEAKVLLEADLAHPDGLTGSYGLWALPDPFEQGVHFFLTYPGATTAWFLNLVDELEHSDLNADPNSDTLLAIITRKNLIIQVTEKAVTVRLLSADHGLSAPLFVPDIPSNSRIVAADFDEDASALLLAVRSDERVYLDLFTIFSGIISIARVGVPLPLDADLTCLSLFKSQGALFGVAALRDGMLHLFAMSLISGVSQLEKCSIGQSASTQMSPVAQSVLVLSDHEEKVGRLTHLIVCGLRNGDMYTVEIGFESQGAVRTQYWRHPKTIKLGAGPVTLFRNEHALNTAFALCDHDTCTFEYNTGRAGGLSVTSIFLTDSTNPDMVRPKLSALRPLALFDSDNTQIACIDGTTLRIANIDGSPRVIPRRIPLNRNMVSKGSLPVSSEPSGTPLKLLYSPRLDTLVIGSVKFERKAPSTAYSGPKAPYVGNRTNRGALQFLPLASKAAAQITNEVQPKDKSTLLELLPGERPMSMVEFTFRRDTEKPGYYHFLLAGTKWAHADDSRTGRLLLLQPTRTEDETIQVALRMVKRFDAPIRALAVYESKIVLSGNRSISILELDRLEGGHHFNKLCTIDLPSHAINITTSPPYIHVTTAADSIQTFELLSELIEGENAKKYSLRLISSDSISRESLTHFPLHLPPSALNQSNPSSSAAIAAILNPSSTTEIPNLILGSDRAGTIFGLSHPLIRSYQTAAQTYFELSLPQCVTHFAQCSSIRPPWRRIEDRGVIADDIIGSCTDGTIYSFTIVDNKTRLLLKFLENLIKWNGEEDVRSRKRGWFLGDGRITIDPEREFGDQKRKTGYGINGDLLEVLIEDEGVHVLKKMLEREDVGGADDPDNRWNGNEKVARSKKFSELVGALAESDQSASGLDEMVGRCVVWLRGVMVQML